MPDTSTPPPPGGPEAEALAGWDPRFPRPVPTDLVADRAPSVDEAGRLTLRIVP